MKTATFDTASARKVGSHDGVDVYLAKQGGNASAASVCLLLYPTRAVDDWVAGCSEGDRFTVTLPGDTMSAESIRHGAGSEDLDHGAVRVSENVIVHS